jgi:DNA repair photolyase
MAAERPDQTRPVGRGSSENPANRFLSVHREPDYEHLADDEEFLKELRRPRTQYFRDSARTIISENDSPDVPFRYSLNPYRGCLHGCSYCYARPTHEYLGLSAGLDFETKIFYRDDAPRLFRDWLNRPAWQCETIMLSGVTDCYQPVERDLRITRGCLEVALEARQPVSLITKNALILRDLDLLSKLAEQHLCRVAISLSTLDQSLTRVLEPACSSPAARLEAIRGLSESGVPVHLMTAPLIPGLTDVDFPEVLRLAATAGARSAGYILVRLPLTVEPVFLEWLQRHRPDQQQKVQSRLRSIRGGKLSQSEFHVRMRGEGVFAEQIAALFRLNRRKNGLSEQLSPLRTDLFRPPADSAGQRSLF